MSSLKCSLRRHGSRHHLGSVLLVSPARWPRPLDEMPSAPALRLEAKSGMLVLGVKWVPNSSNLLAAFCTFRETR